MKQLTQKQMREVLYSRLKHLFIEHIDPLKSIHDKIMESDTRPPTKLENERAFDAYNRVLDILNTLEKGGFVQVVKKKDKKE